MTRILLLILFVANYQISKAASEPLCETTFIKNEGIKCISRGCKRCVVNAEAARAYEQEVANKSPDGVVPNPSPLICVCDPGFDKNCNLVRDTDPESSGFKCEGTCKNVQNKCSMVIYQDPKSEENSIECRCLAGASTVENKQSF